MKVLAGTRLRCAKDLAQASECRLMIASQQVAERVEPLSVGKMAGGSRERRVCHVVSFSA